MMQLFCLAILNFGGFLVVSAHAQHTIHPFAGGGPLDGTPAVDVALDVPLSLASSASGELYVAAATMRRVFKVSANGAIAVVAAGNGPRSIPGELTPARQTSLQYPAAVAVDPAGNVYIADLANNQIWKVSPGGEKTTVAGNGNPLLGDGGSALNASFSGPRGLALDAAGNLYVADSGNNRVRKITTAGVVVTVAGNGNFDYSGDGGPATSASLAAPESIALDASGNLYITTSTHHRIRKVAPDGIITTVAGNGSIGFSGDGGPATAASLRFPYSISTDSAGNLYIADSGNARVRKVSPGGIINTVAGNGTSGLLGDGGPALAAWLPSPHAVVLDRNGNLYIADGSGRIRKVSSAGLISTVAGNGFVSYSGDGGPAKGAQLNRPTGLARDSAGNLYIADTGNHRVRKVSPAGIIATVAGNGQQGSGADGIPAIQSSLAGPRGVAVDPAGDLYIADLSDRVRKVTRDGTIRTVAGARTQALGDGGPAIAASILGPCCIAFDASGNLYIVDNGHSRVRKVNTQGIISTVAGNGDFGFSGDGGPATSASLWQPVGIALDKTGNVYIADYSNLRVRKVSLDGIITTVAGNGALGFSGEGGFATSASIVPSGLAVDAGGSLLLTDSGRLRRVSPSGIITTLAGDGVGVSTGDGGPATQASFIGADDIALDPNGSIYVSETTGFRVRILVPNLSVQPTALSFTYQIGTVPPSPQTILASGNAILTSASASTTSGVPWLSVSPLSATTPTAYSASISPSGLAPGVHTGTIRISSTDGRLFTIPVTLTVTSFCTYSVSPPSLSLSAASTPATLTVTVNSGCPWTAVSNSPWISVTSGASGSASGAVSLAVEGNSGPPRTGSLIIAGQTITVTQASTMTSGLRFVPLIPCRIIDTRPNAIFAANETRAINLPSSNCNVPAGAAAYSLNVTAIPAGPLGYLSMWATGQPRPLVSTLNSHDGRIKANAAIAAAGTGGAVNVFVTDPTHVVLDINGYFTQDAGAGFYPTPACREVDTRYFDFLGPNSTYTINIAGRDCSMPSNAVAYSLNITAVPIHGPLGYLTTWAAGQPQPMVSTLNSPNGTITANAAIVPAGVNGAIHVFLTGISYFIIDSNGYFASPGQPNERTFYPVTPCRVIDTRLTTIMAAGETRTIHVPSSPCNIPATAKAYSLNATVVPTGLLAYITLWPSDAAQPYVSTLNDYDGVIVSNAAIVPAASNGSINAFVTNTTHLILDINGYFQ